MTDSVDVREPWLFCLLGIDFEDLLQLLTTGPSRTSHDVRFCAAFGEDCVANYFERPSAQY